MGSRPLLTHPIAAVAWNPTKQNALAAASEDGIVRIWNIDLNATSTPFFNVDHGLEQAEKFSDDEDWASVGRAVALIRSQSIKQTQKLRLVSLEDRLRKAADESLTEVTEQIPSSGLDTDALLTLQSVIDLDPTAPAGDSRVAHRA